MSINRKKGQSSIEYLSIVGIALLMLVPATILFTNYTRSTNDEIVANQYNVVGNTILEKAEEMYVLGEDSWVTIEVMIPESLLNATLEDNGRELVLIHTSTSDTSSTVFFTTRFYLNNGTATCGSNCALYFNPGLNRIRIQMKSGEVEIKRVN